MFSTVLETKVPSIVNAPEVSPDEPIRAIWYVSRVGRSDGSLT